MTNHKPAMLPIRDAARETGVNPVTLRAWERRYGLVKPHRTAKGHRLYSADQLQQIQQILTWLERGVAISQVATLLREQPEPSTPELSLWQHQIDLFLLSLSRFDGRQLASQYRELMALYPAQLVCAQLLEPVLDELEQRPANHYGNQLEKQFLQSWLHNQLTSRLTQEQEHNQGARLVLANLSDTSPEPRQSLLCMLLSSAGYQLVMLEGQVPASELTLLHERCPLQAMVLISSQRMESTQLERELPRLNAQTDCQRFAVGPIIQMHANELSASGIKLLSNSPAKSFELLHQQLAAPEALS